MLANKCCSLTSCSLDILLAVIPALPRAGAPPNKRAPLCLNYVSCEYFPSDGSQPSPLKKQATQLILRKVKSGLDNEWIQSTAKKYFHFFRLWDVPVLLHPEQPNKKQVLFKEGKISARRGGEE